MYKDIKIIAFDADDTLWVNETYFREAENKFATLLNKYETENKIHQELYKKEIDNLKIYGYGVKGFVLSMIECALEISNYNVEQEVINEILEIGKSMLAKPIELLDHIEEVLIQLQNEFKLIVVTKGDLLDQERKLEKSGILKYFHHVEVLSEKKPEDYKKLIDRLDMKPTELLMIGNSLKSDVLPLLEIGASAIHIPFHTTWQHETVAKEEKKKVNYQTFTSIKEVLQILK